jgi:diguanylate cyclase (GGDEF)-like protein
MFSFMRSRAARVTVWLAGYTVYLTLVCILIEQSAPRALVAPGLWLLSVWCAVMLLLVLLPPDPITRYGIRLALLRATWLCAGAVVLAAVLPGSARYLVLVVPFIGIAFAASRLNARDMLLVVLVTWLACGVTEAWLVWSRFTTIGNSALFFGVFSLSLAAMLSSALEIVEVNTMLVQQRLGLQQHLDQLAVAAMQDELTGVFNRRSAMDVLTRELSFADRENLPLAICYCDLDHFKTINDRFGHAQGDQALKAFAGLALSLVRSVDYVARFGGEEFLLILVGANAERAAAVAQRLCAGTREIHHTADMQDVCFTVSCGVTDWKRGETLHTFLERADQALYAAKRQGRDQVVVV